MHLRKFKLLFFGSDNFSVNVLNRLLDTKIVPIEIVTKAGSPLYHYSAKNKLNIYRWPLEHGVIEENDLNIGLVASFGHMIDVETINRFKFGLFNIHPSLLPQFRGSSPIQAAILNDLNETGCTIMEIPPIAKFDIGNILLQERLPIKKGEYAFELSGRLADLGSNLAQQLLINYDHCRTNSKPQIEEQSSYARKIKPDQGLIRFKSEGAELIDRKVRAYTGTIDLHTYFMDMKLKLEAMRDITETESINLERAIKIHHRYLGSDYYLTKAPKPGTIFFHKPRHLLGIKAQNGQWVSFDYLTPDNKPRMSAVEFYNGYLSPIDPENLVTDF